MRLVRVRDLFEQDVVILQRLGERQRLLVVHIVVPGTVYQHVLFTAYSLRSSRDIRMFVSDEIVLRSRQSHESFRVDGICNESDTQELLPGVQYPKYVKIVWRHQRLPSFFFSITVIDPGSHRRDRYTAFEDEGIILRKYHASGEAAVAPTPYTSSVRVDPLVFLLQNSTTRDILIFRATFAVGNEVIFDHFRITHAVTAIVSSTSTIPIFRYISKSMLLPLKAEPRASIRA